MVLISLFYIYVYVSDIGAAYRFRAHPREPAAAGARARHGCCAVGRRERGETIHMHTYIYKYIGTYTYRERGLYIHIFIHMYMYL